MATTRPVTAMTWLKPVFDGITAHRSPRERLVAVLHLLTSLALSLLYLFPALLLLVGADMFSRELFAPPGGEWRWGILANILMLWGGVLAPAATLLARINRWIQRVRLGDTPLPVVTEPLSPTPVAPWRWLVLLYGREAWSCVLHSTVIGAYGLAAGALALGLAAYGTGATLGALMGVGYAVVYDSLATALGDPLITGPLAVLVVGPAAAFVGVRVAPALVDLENLVVRSPLFDAPEARVRRRLLQLRDSRLRMVDAAEAERRRIERDLHDGAQQRLLAVTMTLTRARAKFDRDPDQARALVEEARQETKAVMAELREVARGLHPRVLTDHGLEAALPVAAGRCPIPVRVEVDLPTRPSARAEGVAYYVACEALTNVAKHADASTITVRAERVRRRAGDLLRLTVTDDGRGGADPDRGTGLYGLWDRVDAVDGALSVDSPEGGGTVLTADIPWEA
ncbi:Signal transduction histidine kinase [Marinactinospora thermotolerans DSM 45154]|uniref:histidine kinase n=1 Tax=Marinactinospora thermotolerans DSM 45154 TaxID=1122192 RepID=A0A1T4TAN7_9ACTN|nr:histidine kinase [Marinactinospora thermotolerans]SKA37391.1 Signal transduction histidine kinase [Marinactinospora thermotolerans DSM 45154]